MLTWCLFITDACLIVVANFKYGDVFAINLLGEKELYPNDLNRKWYVDVGGSIIFAMFLNIFFPHILDMLTIPLDTDQRYQAIHQDARYAKLKNTKVKLLSQDKLNKLHKGPPFDMTLNYAVSINTIMVTMFFCSGMPILLLFASLQFYLKYNIDKYLYAPINLSKVHLSYTFSVSLSSTASGSW